MDDICWWHPHGSDHAGRRNVSSLATYHASRGVLSEHGHAGPHRFILRHRHRSTYLLYNHHCCCKSRNLDIPSIIC